MDGNPETTNENALKQEYLNLTRKQTEATNWKAEDVARLMEVKKQLGIDQSKTLNEQQREVLIRQTTAGTPLSSGDKPQPELTTPEQEEIVRINAPVSN